MIKQAQVETAGWWEDMSKKDKEAYVKAHPNSKYAKQKTGPGMGGTNPGPGGDKKKPSQKTLKCQQSVYVSTLQSAKRIWLGQKRTEEARTAP